METYAVYLRPRGSLGSTLSSDTLFGAVCWGIQLLGLKPDLGEWLAGLTTPPYAFSATLPVRFSDGKPSMRFYPRPATFERTGANDSPVSAESTNAQSKLTLATRGKRLKQAAYVSEAAMGLIANGQTTADTILAGVGPIRQAGRLLVTVDEARLLGDDWSPWFESPVQHNQIDRVAGATVEGLLFYQLQTHFAFDGGLWALLRAAPDDMENLIRPALRLLADTGLGANRTVGQGHFEITIEKAPTLPASTSPNAVMMLSRYVPTADELPARDAAPLAYRLTTLRPKREQRWPRVTAGQVTTPIYKQPVRMFEPGSVFPLSVQREVYGRIVQVVDADDGGPVYQSGAAIPLPMRL